MLIECMADRLDFIKFFPIHSVGPFHIAIELRRTGRDYKELNIPLPNGFLKSLHKFRSAVDLDGLDFKRKFRLQILPGIERRQSWSGV